MRITKLHLLLFFLLAGAGIYGAYFWKERQARLAKAAQTVPELPLYPAAAAPPPVRPAPPAAVKMPEPALSEQQRIEGPVTYVTRRGDTLWKIAKMPEHFGKGHRWYDIWKANEGKISDFDRVRAGLTLTIPLDKPDGHKWPRTSESRKKKILGEAERNYN